MDGRRTQCVNRKMERFDRPNPLERVSKLETELLLMSLDGKVEVIV